MTAAKNVDHRVSVRDGVNRGRCSMKLLHQMNALRVAVRFGHARILMTADINASFPEFTSAAMDEGGVS